jgi:membrane protein required for colicin V production
VNSLDIIFISILVLLSVIGLTRGWRKEIFPLVAIVAAFFIANWLYPAAASYLFIVIENTRAADILGYAVVFLATLAAVGLINMLISFFMEKNPFKLKVWSRLGGAAVGLLKGFLVILVTTMVLVSFMHPKNPLLKESSLVPYLISGSRVLAFAAPDKLENIFDKEYKNLKKSYKENVKKTLEKGSKAVKEFVGDSADAVKEKIENRP